MRYWDADAHDFAAAWRAQRKWVASGTLKSAGENATLVDGDVEVFVRRQKAEVEGDMDVAGPDLVGNLTSLGLIDEYRVYFRPSVLGAPASHISAATGHRFTSSQPILLGRMWLG